MKSSEVKIGSTYRVKVSGKLADVRITAKNPQGGWDGTNVATNRPVRIRSAQRLRGEATGSTTKAKAAEATAFAGLSGSQFTDAINAATAKTLKAALAGEKLSAKQRTRIEAALASKSRKKSAKTDAARKADIARTVEAVETGDLTEGVTVPTGPKKTGGATKAKMSGLDAAAQVLAETGEPLNAKQIVERMLAQKLWTTNGKTPDATIYSAMIREITTKGSDSRFRKASRGMFTFTGKGA